MSNNFKCNICEKEFTTKHLLIKHTNRKKSCYYDRRDIIEEQIKGFNNKLKNDDNTSINSDKHMCTYCKTPYSNKSNLKTHLKKNCNKRNELTIRLNSFQQELCIVNKKINEIEGINGDDVNEENDENEENEGELNVEIDDDTYNKLDKKTLIKMLKAVKEKETKTKSITNNTNNINGDNNTTNNINNQQINNVTNNIQINLNNYDEPNCDFLTMEQKNKFLKDRYKGLIDFITYVYFNESYPENHTVLYTNLRSKYGHIYKNNKWIAEEIDMIADRLNKESFDKLSQHLDDIKGDKMKAIKYEKDIEKGDKFIDHYMSNDTSKESNTVIKKTLYNNKDVVTKTRDKIDKEKKIKKLDQLKI
jgi:hypothetical protein